MSFSRCRILAKFFISVSLFLISSMALERCVQKSVKGSHFIHRLDKGGKMTIGALGTSLTGGRWRWFDAMKEWINEDYPEQVTYVNMGYGASASSPPVDVSSSFNYPIGKSGLEQMRKLIASSRLDVVFIEFAVNDSYKPYNISLEKSRQSLNRMIDTLQRAYPQVEIILMTTNPIVHVPSVGENADSLRSDLLSYFQMYREVAQERKLQIIDSYPVWNSILERDSLLYMDYVKDGIHPQTHAYREVLLPFLKQEIRGEGKR